MVSVLGNVCKKGRYSLCFVEWGTLRKVRIHKAVIQKGAGRVSELGYIKLLCRRELAR